MKRKFLCAMSSVFLVLLAAAIPLWKQHQRMVAIPQPKEVGNLVAIWEKAKHEAGKPLKVALLAETLTAEQCRTLAEAHITEVLPRWACVDGKAAFAWLAGHPQSKEITAEMEAAWAAADTAAYAAWLEKQPSAWDLNDGNCIMARVRHLMLQDSLAAIRLAASMADKSPYDQLPIDRNDLRPAIRNAQDAAAIGNMILEHPEWYTKLEKGKFYYLLEALGRCWISIDSEGWEKWASAHAEAATRAGNQLQNPSGFCAARTGR
jgi:hypothetical protein